MLGPQNAVLCQNSRALSQHSIIWTAIFYRRWCSGSQKDFLVLGHSALDILNFLQTIIAQISPGFTGFYPLDKGVTVDYNYVIDFFLKKGLLVQGL